MNAEGANALNGDEASLPEVWSEFLDNVAGVFVTLTAAKKLRGCIGFMTRKAGLGGFFETLDEAVQGAALRDPRFAPVRPEELETIEIGITLLGPSLPLDDPEAIQIGKHGLLVQEGAQRGVLLPQVARERGWSPQEFLKHTCGKAGLSENAWQRASTSVQYFEAWVF